MKPVPISQYLDHIGRVAQSDSQPQRSSAPVFKPRAVRVVHDQEQRPAPAVNRVLRDAAMASRQPQNRQERAEPASGWLAGDASPAPVREAPPAPDIEERLAEAYERGLRDGAAAARAEDAETVLREQASRQEKEIADRLDFQVNEYGRLAETITTGLAEIEDRIAASVTRILAPLLTSEVTKKIVDDLCVDIERLCSGGAPGLITIRGPESLLGVLRERVANLPVEVEFVAEDAVEATVEAQHTIIRSQLRPWADLIASFII